MNKSTESEFEYTPAGLGRRLGALLYDGLLLVAMLMLLTTLVVILNGGEAIPSQDPLFKTFLFFSTFFYFGWHWVQGGHTLGMRAWRIRIRQVNGKPITWWNALLRFMLALPSVMFFGIGFLWVLFDKSGQTWHDKLAETIVYNEKVKKIK